MAPTVFLLDVVCYGRRHCFSHFTSFTIPKSIGFKSPRLTSKQPDTKNVTNSFREYATWFITYVRRSSAFPLIICAGRRAGVHVHTAAVYMIRWFRPILSNKPQHNNKTLHACMHAAHTRATCCIYTGLLARKKPIYMYHTTFSEARHLISSLVVSTTEHRLFLD